LIDVERSTFNYLPYETSIYQHPEIKKNLPITFVDIEGATDAEKSPSIANYLELIKKADCDFTGVCITFCYGGSGTSSIPKPIEFYTKRKPVKNWI
jgi:hypothetical protein